MADLNQISTHEDAPTPVEGTPEHEQAMVELAESVSAVEREDGKPSWLPEKFESPEDMAQAYKELEKKLSSNTESVPNNDEVTPPPQTPSPHQQAQIQEAQKTLANAGLDYNKFANEYAEKGELSPESYTELKSKGMSTEMVDSWIEGQEAISERLTKTAFGSVGGEQNYQDLVKWAGETLPKDEIDAFNRALESPNNQDSLFAIKSLNAQYQLANGSSPNLIQGSTGKSSSGTFTSLAQMSEAMNDPKYQTDPAFREEVSRKLEGSNLM